MSSFIPTTKNVLNPLNPFASKKEEFLPPLPVAPKTSVLG